MKKRIIIVLGILIAAGGIGTGVWYHFKGNGQSGTGDSIVYVSKVSVITGSETTAVNRFAGVVEPQKTVNVKIESGRKVKEVEVKTGEEVKAGQLIEADLSLVLGNDITSPVAIHEMERFDKKGVFDKDKIALVLDHFVPNKDIKSAEHCKCVREFAGCNEITNFFDVGEMGIEHALLPEKGLTVAGDVIIGAGLKISLVYLVVGIADFIYQKYRFNEEMKMTKQEVKDEFKNTEGDPQIKGRQRRKMQEVSQKRMMQDVPKADVVITNPTHFAVALKYEAKVSSAPVVLAKGEDYLAQKIKEVARENKIEIVENKPLARMLYHNVDVGAEIPPELYQAVAEVLAAVYKAKNIQ